VQVGEEHLAGTQHGPLRRLRLLDLDDHVGRGKDRRRVRSDAGSGGAVVGIGGADAGTGTGFDQHLVA
jgi:hypothetical protein